jgi:WYL domain
MTGCRSGRCWTSSPAPPTCWLTPPLRARLGSDPKIREALARHVLTVFAHGPLFGPTQVAVIRRRKVRLTYTNSARERTERLVDPWGLVDKDDIWYLLAGTERGQRTFRVDRIIEARFVPVLRTRFGRHCHTDGELDHVRARVRLAAPKQPGPPRAAGAGHPGTPPRQRVPQPLRDL